MSRPRYATALVVGWGASGRAAADLLRARGTSVRVYDQRADIDAPKEYEVFAGDNVPPPAAFASLDLMVLSPGVSPRPHLAACQTHAPHATVHGELGLALESLPSGIPTALITGTNGKSTVTALLGQMLRAAGQHPFVGGNLGDPPSVLAREVALGMRAVPQALILECSSYQLETLRPKDTNVGIVLNISRDHLDRYDSMKHYAEAKATVFDGMAANGLALLDADDPWTPQLSTRVRTQLQRIGDPDFAHIVDEGPNEVLVVNGERFPRGALPGRHNAKNALFAIAAARHLGVSAHACAAALTRFRGLPHRMALVRELAGVRYYNDSKATNVASAVASLGGLREPFVVIAGGLAKAGDDPAALTALIRARGRGVVAMGASAAHFLALPTGRPAIHARSMDEAVACARKLAQPGDVVVLAPACASFDAYKNFAERGDCFERAVLQLEL